MKLKALERMAPGHLRSYQQDKKRLVSSGSTRLNNREIDKYKARLVAKGYKQQHEVDYTEVFAPVARLDIVRIIIALSAQRGWILFQLDVKLAFLHGELSENVYIEQLKGYEKKGREHLVYKLHKALYCLNRIEAYFIKEGFKHCDSEQTLFTKREEDGKIIIVSLYVNDLIFTRNNEIMLSHFNISMMKEFEMSDLGKLHYFLGIEVL